MHSGSLWVPMQHLGRECPGPGPGLALDPRPGPSFGGLSSSPLFPQSPWGLVSALLGWWWESGAVWHREPGEESLVGTPNRSSIPGDAGESTLPGGALRRGLGDPGQPRCVAMWRRSGRGFGPAALAVHAGLSGGLGAPSGQGCFQAPGEKDLQSIETFSPSNPTPKNQTG